MTNAVLVKLNGMTHAGMTVRSQIVSNGILLITLEGCFTGKQACTDFTRLALDHDTPTRMELAFSHGVRMTADFVIDELKLVGNIHGEECYRMNLRSTSPVECI